MPFVINGGRLIIICYVDNMFNVHEEKGGLAKRLKEMWERERKRGFYNLYHSYNYNAVVT